MSTLTRLVRRACEWLAAHHKGRFHMPLREILRGTPPNEEPYLDRYYLFGKQPAYFPERCRNCKQPIPVTSATHGPQDPRPCRLGPYMAGMRGTTFCAPEPFPERLKFLPTVFLHHFRDSDQEAELHNHPWESAYSLILAGGYIEERRIDGDTQYCLKCAMCLTEHAMRSCKVAPDGNHVWTKHTTELRNLKPGAVNRICKDDFHRVTLFEHDAWSLFITGKKAQSWCFWSKETDEVIPWKQYRAWKETQTGEPNLGPDPLLSQKEVPEGHVCSPPELALREVEHFRVGCAWTCYVCNTPATFDLRIVDGKRAWVNRMATTQFLSQKAEPKLTVDGGWLYDGPVSRECPECHTVVTMQGDSVRSHEKACAWRPKSEGA